jgi:glucosamine--fructose-6-phosphate aminotransferase (isomerizing)
MCGIFGIYAENGVAVDEFASKIVKGLSLLEYRGYDSAGLSVQNINGSTIICKTMGNVSKLKSKVSDTITTMWASPSPSFNIGISHTRWATHGPPSDVNSHPHVSDPDKTFTVVHNGIISNYKALRDMLTMKGFEFESDTDTEVVPKLCMMIHNETHMLSFQTLVTKVVSMLQGTYALLITSRIYPNQMVACRYGSPLIIGMSVDNGVCMFSSDVNALVDCNKIYIMEDNEMFHITQSERLLYNIELRSKDIMWKSNTVTASDVEKGEFSTFMMKEIYEQPKAVMKTMQLYTVTDDKTNIGIHFANLDGLLHKIKNAQALVLLGCGTSYHSCLASKFIMSELMNKHVYVEVAGQFAEVEPKLSADYVYCFVSQSGETAETLEALRYVKRHMPHVLCIGITNKPKSSIAREVTYCIDLNAGLEISVASTKAYTCQMTALAMFALNFKNIVGNCDMQVALRRVPDLIKTTLLSTECKIKKMAKNILGYNSILFVGRANDYATALEAALKVKEIAYVHSEGVMASELKHGPLALIDDRVCLVVFATRNAYYQKMVSVIEQLKARKAHIFVVCDEYDTNVKNLLEDDDRIIEVPVNHEFTQHIINIIPMQLLAFHLATMKGNKVDQPRNLAKSVTVSD